MREKKTLAGIKLVCEYFIRPPLGVIRKDNTLCSSPEEGKIQLVWIIPSLSTSRSGRYSSVVGEFVSSSHSLLS